MGKLLLTVEYTNWHILFCKLNYTKDKINFNLLTLENDNYYGLLSTWLKRECFMLVGATIIKKRTYTTVQHLEFF
jgi:hypothetical protein